MGIWRKEEHPRDDIGRFTFKNGSIKEKGIIEHNPAHILYGFSKDKEDKIKYRNKLIDILKDKLTHAQILYSKTDELEEKVKENGKEYSSKNELKGDITGGASCLENQETSSKTKDYGFNEPIWNIPYYDKLSKKYNKELGNFLRKNTDNPEYYSNDLRHQFVSAIFARNLGDKASKIMGDLNELKPTDLFNPVDSKIDKINNEIGRNYAKLYPNIAREKLLNIMLKEHSKNQQIRIQKMQEKSEKQKKLEREYM